HFGPGAAQVGDEVGERLAVLLDGDAPAAQVLGEQVVPDLGAGLGGGRPVVVEAGGADGAPGLGPAGEQAGGGEVADQVGGEAPAFGGGHPAAEADAGGDHHVVDGRAQALPGGGEQVGVLGERDEPDGGGAQHTGAAPFEQRPELLAPPGGRDADGEARQRVRGRLGRGGEVPAARGRHAGTPGRAPSTRPGITVTSTGSEITPSSWRRGVSALGLFCYRCATSGGPHGWRAIRAGNPEMYGAAISGSCGDGAADQGVRRPGAPLGGGAGAGFRQGAAQAGQVDDADAACGRGAGGAGRASGGGVG